LARLIKTEKEVEGRVEEAWIVVEEDGLVQWPEGPLAVVGRAAARVDGPARARGEARYTADVRLPGMLHAAILRSPHASAVATRVDLDRARSAPGVRAVLEPGACPGLEREAGYHGAPVAAVAADSRAEAEAALALVDVEWEVREPLLDPDEAVARGSLHR
jgi:xanthine dehydrogenase YagR molybdenum-binding subunit